MKDIDQKIQAALRGETASAELGAEPNLAEELITAFRGRHRWANGSALVFSILIFAGAVWAGRKFYLAEEVREQLQWGGACLLGVLMVSFIKVWMWLEVHSNRTLRELKRLELLLLQQKR